MDLENQLPPFAEWWGGAALVWCGVLALVYLVALFVGFVATAMRVGPGRAGDAAFRLLGSSFWDVMSISPRRVWALARLAIKEARQSRVFIGFVLFVVFLMFAIWFEPRLGLDPVKLMVDRVFWVVTFVVWTSAVLLSCFSIPTDITRRTIFTVVTKPVRPSEIVLGRIVGFSLVGSMLLAAMGVVSYLFVKGAVRHGHGVSNFGSGETDATASHRHLFDAKKDEVMAYVGFGLQVETRDGDGQTVKEDNGTVAQIEREGPAASLGVAPGDVLTSVGGQSVATRRQALDALRPLSPGEVVALEFRREGANEAYEVKMPVRPRAFTEYEQGHYHEIDQIETTSDGKLALRYVVSDPLDQFHARMPVYGKLSFRDRSGKEGEQGINVGYEWSYRSYIEGGGQSAAIWTFRDLDEADFPEGLPLEMTLRVFRTHQGNVNKGILGTVTLRNPKTREELPDAHIFEAVEFGTYSHRFDDRDLFDKYVDEGELEIEVKCLQRGQHFGMAQADVYLMPREGSFEMSMVKAYLALWLQMAIITSYGVMFSTYLNGAVSLLATIAATLAGFVKGLMLRMGLGEQVGGGPFESMVRLLNQDSMIGDLDPDFSTQVLLGIDTALQLVFLALAQLVPSLPSMGCSDYLVNGYDVPWNVIFIHSATTVGYALPLFFFGFIFFKVREVAK